MSSIAKEIIDRITSNRPNLSNGTIKTYTSLLMNVLKKLNSDKIDTLNDTNKVIEYVSNLTSDQTKKTILASLYVLTGNEEYKKT